MEERRHRAGGRKRVLSERGMEMDLDRMAVRGEPYEIGQRGERK
jgi:hypothetical protein